MRWRHSYGIVFESQTPTIAHHVGITNLVERVHRRVDRPRKSRLAGMVPWQGQANCIGSTRKEERRRCKIAELTAFMQQAGSSEHESNGLH